MAERPDYRWYHKLSGLLFVMFCFEMGIFLLVLPWTEVWETNYFSWIAPEAGWWRWLWLSPYARGGISGLGLINIYIAFTEVFRLRRSAAEGTTVRIE
jgi:hypothetical protein